jgi:hypothetical protein
VRDWYNRWQDDEIDRHFSTSLVGIAAVFYGEQVTNEVDQVLPRDRDALLERVAVNGGLLEPESGGGRGKSLTFCAFDPGWPEPSALAGTLNRKELFVRTFEKYRRDYLEVGKGMQHTAATREADEHLARFIFELYQNTYEHGRRVGADGKGLPGMRYVRLRKYIDRKRNFLARATGFEEMTKYLQSVVPEGDFKFYEVTVSDDGLGMIDHFLNTRPDFKSPKTQSERVALVNELVTTSLTSKRDFPGAGGGLPNVLEALRDLRGFVSLRTDQVWLCGHSEDKNESLEKQLQPVRCDQAVSRMVGTQVNILLPLRRQ